MTYLFSLNSRFCFPKIFFIIFSLLILNGINNVWAANLGKISGRVIDRETEEPLVGVNVIVQGTYMGAATDIQGDYFIANIPVHIYTVKVSAIGYREITVEDVRVNSGKTTRLDFELERMVIEIEGIVVTAERKLVDEGNTSSSMILSSRDIVDYPTTDFSEILTTLPSINIEEGEMKIRGGSIDEVAFVIDGARARNPMDHSPYTRFNISSVQEVEVITGAFDAEYGEARSGVINIVTKEGSDRYELFVDTRYTPPGKRHWGDALYDQNTTLYWENTHARHAEWWVENTDQWADTNGVYGYDPDCIWTPEEAYDFYLDTHKPLTDYTNIPNYQTEISFGGPIPFIDRFYFFITGKYRSEAPLFGNSYREKGIFFDGTFKLNYNFTPSMKLTFSGFWGNEKTSWGIGGLPDYFYAESYGITSRYAYYDWEGVPDTRTSGQTLTFNHILGPSSLVELKLNRVHAKRKVWVFPDDPIGWEAGDATYDILRAVTVRIDTSGEEPQQYTVPVIGGYQNRYGYHTTGYYYRFDDENTEYVLAGYYSNQINKFWYLKTGLDFNYYNLDHFNQSKFPDRRDDNVYNPYQGAFYVHNKLEFGGLIMNVGLRYDFYNTNSEAYSNLFDPFNSPTEKTKTFTQISPRLGFSHPIDEKTVLHFNYGHFFQRTSFGDYGENNEGGEGSLTTYTVDGEGTPWVLGNRNIKPEKTVAFEIGIERNIADIFTIDVTGYYRDIRNTVRPQSIESPFGMYFTNGNGDYADFRGIEFSIRKLPSPTRYGSVWGYANYTSQLSITGKSGDPIVIREDGPPTYGTSGDAIGYHNPRLKAGLFYQTPGSWNAIGGLFGNVVFSIDYQATFPNENIWGDYFVYGGEKYMRPADKNAKLRVKKEFDLLNKSIRVNPYIEVYNLFNDKWIYFDVLYSASDADQKKFVESNFEDVPDQTSTDVPILDFAKYRNLPRSIFFGMTINL